MGGLIAVWAGRLSRSGKGRADRPATNAASGRGMATTTNAHQPRPSGVTRMLRVLTLPPGASLVNPRTGQTLWRTPALVALPSGRPRQLTVELPGHKRHFITLTSTTIGPLRITLKKAPPPTRRTEERPSRSSRPSHPHRRPPPLPTNDQDTVNPFR